MPARRFHEQCEQVRRSMPDVPLAVDESGGFLYERGHLLVRDGEDAHLVADTVRGRLGEIPGAAGRERIGPAGPGNRSGVVRIRVAEPAGAAEDADHAVAGALRAVRAVEARAGRRMASRNHVISVTPNACPGDEPVPAPPGEGPNPAPAEPAHHPDAPVGVLVVDTGLTGDHARCPLLARVRGDLETAERDADGLLRQYAGHGTFIAGVLAAVAPHTDITVSNALNEAGAVLESEFGGILLDAAEQAGWPALISLSAGTSTGGDEGLLGLERFMAELLDHPGTLLVAAAGNNGNDIPFFPAAYAAKSRYAKAVLSVGALRGDGEGHACFSNHGRWVDVYAPGERLTGPLTGFDAPVPYVYQHSSYDECRHGGDYSCTCRFPAHSGLLSADGTASPAEPERVEFTGYARWSGTSFATPLVAAMIAAHMAAHKETDPRRARRDLLAAHRKETAEVRGRRAPALRPPTWRPVGSPAEQA
ncbi:MULTISPECIES: S8 family peptidase [Streptomyces]|uniref:S8/S53 family peptidase n=1 Tax=Streptomyces chilikensis TaxID=1194079 RepID=A0ABV3ESB6_9ACTN|nr:MULTISPECIES: S8/S53 family peptidase [Streptomyces]MDH6223252.1 subtilisin family serine protease [Streptomyces sp. MJP52]